MSFSDKVLQLKQDFDDVYAVGNEQGKKEVWKCITHNGTRVQFMYGFAYTDLAYFAPFTDLKPINCGYMFALTNGGTYGNGTPIDLVERFNQYGTTLDFSNCTSSDRCFYMSTVTRVGVVDCLKMKALNYFFQDDRQLHTIEKMIVKKEITYSNTFLNCFELENIVFEGEIGNNIDFSSCTKLSHDSLMSIINHLETKTSGTFTLSIGSTNLAKLTDAEKAIATQKGWTLA